MLNHMRERAAREHRMFRVIVLGGFALAASSTSVSACGGSVQTNASKASGGSAGAPGTGGFPSELPAFVDAAGGTGAAPDAFPFEGGGSTSTDASADGFPFEGTGGVAGSADASPDVGCFPMETDMFQECGAPQPDAGAHDAAPEGFPHETASP
jgi:hypothetical protein